MNYLFSNIKSGNLEKKLDFIRSANELKPFEAVTLDFITALSKEILLDQQSRDYPELIAAAHWMRRANILNLKNEFTQLSVGRVLVSKGLVLHFAPSNVDTVFIYSWILSLLLGNKNIVRVSQKRSDLVTFFIEKLKAVFSSQQYTLIANINLILSYPHCELITELLTANSDLRVIWGGDVTIAKIREIPLPVRTDEVVFANRFSLAALKSSAINKLDDQHIDQLIDRFVADTFTYDQNACSSPRAIYFIGARAENKQAQSRFWSKLKSKLTSLYDINSHTTAAAIARFTSATVAAAQNKVKCLMSGYLELPLRVEISELDSAARLMHSGLGLFYEGQLSKLSALANVLNKRDQTLCVYGFSTAELDQFSSELPSGVIDRIVPLGSALTFSHIWDGYNLLLEFSKERFIDQRLAVN